MDCPPPRELDSSDKAFPSSSLPEGPHSHKGTSSEVSWYRLKFEWLLTPQLSLFSFLLRKADGEALPLQMDSHGFRLVFATKSHQTPFFSLTLEIERLHPVSRVLHKGNNKGSLQ